MTNKIEYEKRQMLQNQMLSFLESVLLDAQRQDKLDHINIEISNHNGNLQMNYTLKDRKKAY